MAEVTVAGFPRDAGAAYLAQVKTGETKPNEFMAYILAYIMRRGYFATSAAELAPGVVAVTDSEGELDIYFDPTKWRLTEPSLWMTPCLPEGRWVATDGLAALEGVGGGTDSLVTAMIFAKRNLTPFERVAWHKAPKLIF